MCWN